MIFLLFVKDESIINKLMDDLKKAGATIKKEDDIAGFLGVDKNVLKMAQL